MESYNTTAEAQKANPFLHINPQDGYASSIHVLIKNPWGPGNHWGKLYTKGFNTYEKAIKYRENFLSQYNHDKFTYLNCLILSDFKTRSPN